MVARSLLPILCLVAARIAAAIPPGACGNVIRAATDSDQLFFNAIDVYDCYNSVPFHSPIATEFLSYWNVTLQFLNTQNYLKSPPPGYQKPPIDLIASLEDIQAAIENNTYPNQYRFEASFRNVLRAVGDTHLQYTSGVMSAFQFGTLNGLTSLSVDGIQLPKVYLTDDLILNQTDPSTEWRPSAIKLIGGDDAIDFLTRFAATNSPGTLEPHADWNWVFDNPANFLDLTGPLPMWTFGATLYPGDTYDFTFENGSTFTDKWRAIYTGPSSTGPLETGGDFYNLFVLNLIPAACRSASPPLSCPNPALDDPDDPDDPGTMPGLDLPDAYPQTPDISTGNATGIAAPITGYLLHESSLAVLSLPSFTASGVGVLTFVEVIGKFIRHAKKAGVTKLLIDLQQNVGGDTLLAYFAFRQFFPSIDPYGGSQRRAQPLADFVGSQISPYWDGLRTSHPKGYASVSSNEWIATNRLDATGSNFTSWRDMFGPYWNGVDDFNAVQRLDLLDMDYVRSALANTFNATRLNGLRASPSNVTFAADDIIMLSDGLCSSACALFMEMMHHDAGVRNVVLGGRPSTGPMQTPSGSRGAQDYTLEQLDKDLYNAFVIAISDNSSVPDELNVRGQQSVYFSQGGFSVRSQVRNGSTTPLEMVYEAADCRLFWTPETFNNFTNLWLRAATAAWDSPELCVANSTGFASNPLGEPQKLPPPAMQLPAISFTSQGLPWLAFPDGDVPFLGDDLPLVDGSLTINVGQNPHEADRFIGNLGPSGFRDVFSKVYRDVLKTHKLKEKYQEEWNTLSTATQKRLKALYESKELTSTALLTSIDADYKKMLMQGTAIMDSGSNAPLLRRRRRATHMGYH